MDLALEYSATLTIVSLSSTPPVSRLGICGTFTSFINPLNGSIPKNDISLTVFKAPFIALNGIETTLFIPAIKVLTTDLNALNYTIFNTAKDSSTTREYIFTPFQALPNMFLKNVATDEKIFLIPFQAF